MAFSAFLASAWTPYRQFVAAQCIDVQTNRCLWAERVDGKSDDILSLHDRMIASLAAFMDAKLAKSDAIANGASGSRSVARRGLGEMQLHLRRSQHDGGLRNSKVVFALDARIILPPDEQALIRRYRLGNVIVYSGEAAQRLGVQVGAVGCPCRSNALSTVWPGGSQSNARPFQSS